MNLQHRFAVVLGVLLFSILVEACPMVSADEKSADQPAAMRLGNFSVSLAVKDIKASKTFYEKLDFKEVAGNLKQNWIILQNGATTIGLFQGMFEDNLMTFNPGWDKDQNALEEFQDVRELQKRLKKRGVKIVKPADESTSGPANFLIADPDGNTIFFDQHVAKPE